MAGIDYFGGPPPKQGRFVELYPGIFWIRMQLPFRPGSVNVWALSDNDGWTIVDAGFDTPAARDDWADILMSLGRPRVSRVLMTHAHLDHVGLAGWLADLLGAEFRIARSEFDYAKYLQSDWDLHQFAEFYRTAGCPEEMVGEFTTWRAWAWDALKSMPARSLDVADGDVITMGGRPWRTVASGGHSREQLAFWCEQDGILIGGDQVLPRIQPAIVVTAEEPQADPLADAFAGWERLKTLPADTMVLPSHGEPFRGLHQRLDQLRHFYQDRLSRLISAATHSPVSPFDALGLIYGNKMPSSPRIAVGETQAHLNHLEAQGLVESLASSDGIRRYRRSVSTDLGASRAHRTF